VVWKDKKEFVYDMNKIYTVPTKQAAKARLNNFKKKWNLKYPYAIKSLEYNWDELTFFLLHNRN